MTGCGVTTDLWWVGDNLVGATARPGGRVVVARVGLPTPVFVGTGRHKGVPYDGSASSQGFVVRPRQWSRLPVVSATATMAATTWSIHDQDQLPRHRSDLPFPRAGAAAIRIRSPCPVRAGRKQALGDAFALSQYGVNLVTLPPGTWSSQRHWHSGEDEFIYILEGRPTLVTDDGPDTACAGYVRWIPGGRRQRPSPGQRYRRAGDLSRGRHTPGRRRRGLSGHRHADQGPRYRRHVHAQGRYALRMKPDPTIWDWPLRLWHWAFAGFIAFSLYSGLSGDIGLTRVAPTVRACPVGIAGFPYGLGAVGRSLRAFPPLLDHAVGLHRSLPDDVVGPAPIRPQAWRSRSCFSQRRRCRSAPASSPRTTSSPTDRYTPTCPTSSREPRRGFTTACTGWCSARASFTLGAHAVYGLLRDPTPLSMFTGRKHLDLPATPHFWVRAAVTMLLAAGVALAVTYAERLF